MIADSEPLPGFSTWFQLVCSCCAWRTRASHNQIRCSGVAFSLACPGLEAVREKRSKDPENERKTKLKINLLFISRPPKLNRMALSASPFPRGGLALD
nr:hypothetical protein CFP56_37164 [Quercus suber]